MKTFFRSAQLLAAASCFAFSVAHGAVFNFSYAFGDGLTASGSLSGTQNGQFVDNVTGVSLFFNGTPMPGALFTSRFDPVTGNYLSGPVVSFDVLQNNFVFSNSNFVGGDFAADSFFYITKPTTTDPVTAVGVSFPLGLFGSQDDPAVNSRWSLRAVSTATPDTGATVALLGMTMVGLVWLRRKL